MMHQKGSEGWERRPEGILESTGYRSCLLSKEDRVHFTREEALLPTAGNKETGYPLELSLIPGFSHKLAAFGSQSL